MNENENDNIMNITPANITPVEWEKEDSKYAIIKVIGIGGGGCNAVSYMYEQQVTGCQFFVCNTDSQSLDNSPVQNKIQLGESLRGAGTDPVKGRNAAIEAEEEIKKRVLDDETEILILTAGMGGGTGTGATPVIAKMAKEKGILTIAVVTIPFKNDGRDSHARAIDGLRELEKNVDSLMIINNEKLYDLYSDLLIQDVFPKTDEVLATAVRGITEIIFKTGKVNIDLVDVKTMMKDSGIALLGCGEGTGENRIQDAVDSALKSPLLNDFDLKTAKNVLINITVGDNEEGLKMHEHDEINKKIAEYLGENKTFKSGLIYDKGEDVGDKIHITVIATGFEFCKLQDITDINTGEKIILTSDFRYEPNGNCTGKEITLPEPPKQTVHNVGFNTKENCRTFNFEEGEVPILIVKEGENRGDLENIPAIRRKTHIKHVSDSE